MTRDLKKKIDEWVRARNVKSVVKPGRKHGVNVKNLSIEIPEELHKKIRISSVAYKVSMKELVTKILNDIFDLNVEEILQAGKNGNMFWQRK
ncbi:MAG: hypothetical protein EOM23_00235 [Candidatus Moranbacteria bacterium]|nr:hypothetical protein [Candidatus Moranbacteria bacterium]